VVDVQRLLGVAADGVFGPVTAGAVVAWKRARGEPERSSDLSFVQRRRLLADVRLRSVLTMERWLAEGLAERPPGSDRVPELVELAEHLGVASELRGMGFPWCAFAVFLAALDAGGTTADLGLRDRSFNALYTPSLLAAAQANSFGLRVVARADAFRGDLAVFDWNFAGGDPADHVARLVEPPANGAVRTVDGNSGREGRIALRERRIASVRAFVRDS
jgi:hypothetical protein